MYVCTWLSMQPCPFEDYAVRFIAKKNIHIYVYVLYIYIHIHICTYTIKKKSWIQWRDKSAEANKMSPYIFIAHMADV